MSKWLLAFVGLSMVLGFTGMTATQEPTVLAERDGLRLMRRLMAVQANAPFAGNPGSLADVVGHAQRSGTADATVAAINPETGEVLGYAVRIAPNGSRYEISLTPNGGCGPAWFGNEKNVIYSGKALGC